jgi:hypothetical protein
MNLLILAAAACLSPQANIGPSLIKSDPQLVLHAQRICAPKIAEMTWLRLADRDRAMRECAYSEGVRWR